MDEFTFNLNIFYSSCFETQNFTDFDHYWAVVRPSDKKWAFVDDLSKIVDMETRNLIKDSDVSWHSFCQALTLISEEIKPSLALPHLFCYEGATTYR